MTKVEKSVPGRPPGIASKVAAFQFLAQVKYCIFAEKLQFHRRQEDVLKVQMYTIGLISGSSVYQFNSLQGVSSVYILHINVAPKVVSGWPCRRAQRFFKCGPWASSVSTIQEPVGCRLFPPPRPLPSPTESEL